MYDIIFSPRAKVDIAKLKRDEPNAYKKVVKLVNELRPSTYWHRKARAINGRPCRTMEPPYYAEAPPHL